MKVADDASMELDRSRESRERREEHQELQHDDGGRN